MSKILFDEPMSKHTTFRVGGPAQIYVRPTVAELKEWVKFAKEYQVPLTIIGNGSNLLVSDNGIKGIVAEIGKEMESVFISGNTITAEAGVSLGALANQAAAFALTGLEFAAGIPGTLGGAVVMNAGAYGGEMKDVIKSVTVLDENGEEKELTLEELDLSYRHSCIPEKGYVVVEVTMKLESKDEKSIRETMADFRERRIEKQPLEYPSAGSTFKRPEGYFAGKLIEDAGLSGYQVGGAQVSEKHCGFVINKGGATEKDISTLMDDVAKKVKEQFGVDLEPEVRKIGEF